MESIEEMMKRRLDDRASNKTLRSLRLNDFDVDFYSNDYLSLSTIKTNECANESPGSSRLIAGHTMLHEELENRFSSFIGAESALLFNSGYSANLGLLSSIAQKDIVILYDEKSHASIKDGIRLSLAKGLKFRHNDPLDLEKKLKLNDDKQCFVVTEGLFSMDGTYGKVKELSDLCQKYDAKLIVDEAHSGGTFGDSGQGICVELGVKTFATIFTLGKAFGSHGAIVTCSKLTKKYLINFSRSFIYTTSLPQSVVNRSLQLLDKGQIEKRVIKLKRVIQEFNSIFSAHRFKSHDSSPIKIFQLQDEEKLRALENACHKESIGVKAIFPPTVPEGESCLRIILHADQTQSELQQLLKIFNQELF